METIQTKFFPCRLLTIILCGLILLISAPVHAELLAKPFSARFTGIKFVVVDIESQITLQRNDNYIKYTLETRGRLRLPFFPEKKLYDCSVMKIKPDGIEPLEHKHIDYDDSDYDASTKFDWSTRTAHVEIGDGRKMDIKNLEKYTWDPISLQIRIITDAMNGRLNTPVTYNLLEYGELSQWPIKIHGNQRIQTESEQLDTVIVQRTDGRSYKLWLAPAFSHMPVQVELNNIQVTIEQKPREALRQVLEISGIPHC